VTLILNTIDRGLAKLFRIEPSDLAKNRPVVVCGLLLALVAIALRLFFWWYTGRVWEDALITVLHSENFVKGLGLSLNNNGEPPVHGFTSPLGVLVPLAGDLLKVGFGLSLIKAVSALAGGLTVLYAMAIAIHPKTRLPGPLAFMVMAYLAIEHHQILWGMAGMETQLVTLILLMSIYYAIAARPVALGVSLGLCMLARPDLAFWTLIVGVYVLFTSRRRFLIVAGVAAAVYAPWVIFTTLYYGSPVPNTIVAKSLGYPLWIHEPTLTMDKIWTVLGLRLGGGYEANSIFQPLGPCFGGHGVYFQAILDDAGAICRIMTILAVIGAISAIWSRQREWWVVVGYFAVYSLYYTFLVPNVFGWYIVPFVAITLLLSARGIEATGKLLPAPSTRPFAFGIIAGLYLAVLTFNLPMTFRTEKQIQEIIENNVRKPLGIYMGQTMRKHETVGSECLGYLAYYSRRQVFDWPGLASRKVVEYNRTHPGGREMVEMFECLRPDFIVLRPSYYNACLGRGYKWLESDYTVIRSFDAPAEEAARIPLVQFNIDRSFLVLERKS
jgi:hypothetical protein